MNRVLFLSLMSTVLVIAGCNSSTPEVSEQPESDPAVSSVGDVHLVFHFPSDETIELDAANVKAGTTLESVMRSLELPMEITGTESTAFIRTINGVAMDSSSGWTYKVDGEFASSGIGSYELSPPTEVVWSFGGFDDD